MMAMDDRIWWTPRIVEVGVTIADMRKLIRRANDVGILVRTQRADAASSFSCIFPTKAGVLRAIKYKADSERFPSELDIITDTCWIGA
jgi:hypothetical protein